MNKAASRYRWIVAPLHCSGQDRLVRECNVSHLLAQCLLNRGHLEPIAATRFLDPLLKNLADPFLIPDMELAIARLLIAREKGESIVIIGDYDVDGVTSTAILLETFSNLGFTAHPYLPNRMDEGYGLSDEAAANALAKFPSNLLLAVDCGSTSFKQVSHVQASGVDVIVLDHHQISNPAPTPVALVNPKKNVSGAFQELCSAGLAFKLAHALIKRLRENGCSRAQQFDLRSLLDLVALGTIADVVPLVGENRIFASRGLDWIRSTRRLGLVALKKVAQVGIETGVYDVGFQLAPRLNAAGRLENALQALDLLRAPTLADAEPLAITLDLCNRERQKIEKEIANSVIAQVEESFDPESDYVIVRGDSSWHIGVVGIVASRVLHTFYRPSIILGGEGEEWRGSGRSIEGFDIAQALRECSDLLVKHGGHAMAAGLSIKPEKVSEFRERINTLARRALSPEQLRPMLRLDAEIALQDLSLEKVRELERLQPFGPSNSCVQFVVRGVSHQRAPRRLGKENQHAKFWVTDGNVTFEAVWWNCGADAVLPKVMFDLAFAPEINEFNGSLNVQLKVLDWSPVGPNS